MVLKRQKSSFSRTEINGNTQTIWQMQKRGKNSNILKSLEKRKYVFEYLLTLRSFESSSGLTSSSLTRSPYLTLAHLRRLSRDSSTSADLFTKSSMSRVCTSQSRHSCKEEVLSERYQGRGCLFEATYINQRKTDFFNNTANGINADDLHLY